MRQSYRKWKWTSKKEFESLNVLENVFDNENVFENEFVCVNAFDWVKVFDSVNLFDCVNVFDSVNVSVGIGRHPSIIISFDTLKVPNVSFWYFSNVITDAAGTPEKTFSENVGGVAP